MLILYDPNFFSWSNGGCSLLSLHTVFQDLEEFSVLKGLSLCLLFLCKLSALSLACVLHDVVPPEISCSFSLQGNSVRFSFLPPMEKYGCPPGYPLSSNLLLSLQGVQ
jgi:hypothetical protein